ncbi:hypothetical protein GM3708_2079 [Geminocystis sp. NIES-3708]|uniref:hypothetical protein n=1 Tax=Geminocystis sp. NIES-3708 TaxID=1615909 RepID=UPI0005FCA21D|nr:hypothetical protein [Geminocystis sp. NIES-3708]BAQ61673.1 hypothetical protein GM3708_2079 [Geminocystis sp. NIES-3708]
MDELTKQILEQINLNLNQIAIYIDKITKEEISIDSAKIYLVDYSIYKFLDKDKNKDIKNRLEEYNQQIAKAQIEDNFLDFCRASYLIIEIILHQFIRLEFGEDQITNWEYYKIYRFRDFFKSTTGYSHNDKNLSQNLKNRYYTTCHLMDIRDIGSHANHNFETIQQRIEKKGTKLKVNLKNLDKLEENIIKKIFAQYTEKEKDNNVQIYYKPEENFASITLYNLKNQFLSVENIITDIKNQFNILKYKLGISAANDIYYPPKQPPNNIKIFFDNKDYFEVKNSIIWVLETFDKYINNKD